jgi:hypothetical protein
MTNKINILQEQQKIIPSTREYQDNINFFIISSTYLVKGTILLITHLDVYLDFGTKPIIKVSKKLYIKNLIQQYTILHTSYLLLKRPTYNKQDQKKKLKDWIKIKLNEGQTIRLKIDVIDSIRNIYTINFKKTIEYIKDNKYFHEIAMIKNTDSCIKAFVLNIMKGGFSISLGNLIAFLPRKELVKTRRINIAKYFKNSSINFKISKIDIETKNIVLIKA